MRATDKRKVRVGDVVRFGTSYAPPGKESQTVLAIRITYGKLGANHQCSPWFQVDAGAGPDWYTHRFFTGFQVGNRTTTEEAKR